MGVPPWQRRQRLAAVLEAYALILVCAAGYNLVSLPLGRGCGPDRFLLLMEVGALPMSLSTIAATLHVRLPRWLDLSPKAVVTAARTNRKRAGRVLAGSRPHSDNADQFLPKQPAACSSDRMPELVETDGGR